MRRRKHLAVGLAAAIPATLAMMDSALSADEVLYDTLWYSDDGLTNTGVATYIGSFGFSGQFRDLQGADHFILDKSYMMTSVSADYQTGNGQVPADGFLVEFFADDNGAPADAAMHIAISQNFVMTELPGVNRRRFEVDIADSGLVLNAGLWWVSIIPMDETPTGTIYNWRGSTTGGNGLITHRRCGSDAHGTGYVCPISTNWNLHSPACDLAMKIEGTPVGPKCAVGDLNCDGSVGVPDLLILLANWGECKDCNDCSADLTGSCSIGVPDLLVLLANW